MCNRSLQGEQGEPNLTLIHTRPKRVLTLEEIHELQMTERIEVERELADILREKTISAFISRHKR